MSAEWKGKVSIDGAAKAAGDMESVARASRGAAGQLKSLAGTATGLMAVFHGMRGAMAGDATALVNVASGAAMLWRAASNLHPVLRVLAIGGTGIAAVWPKIAHYFESAATRAERFRQSLINAGVILQGYAKAVSEFSRLNADLDRHQNKLEALEDAWKKLSGASRQYDKAVTEAKLANLNAQEQRELIEADGDPMREAEIRARYARERSDVQYEEEQRSIDDERMRYELETVKAARVSDAANKKAEKAAALVQEARAEYEAAYKRNAESGGRDKDAVKALADAQRNLVEAMNAEADARNEAEVAAERLAGAQDAESVFKSRTEPALREDAENRRQNAIEAAELEMERENRRAYMDIDAARAEDAAFEEEQRFGKLSKSEQRKELDAKIAGQQKNVDAMSDSDPTKAKAIRELTSLKQRRASIGEDAPKEGFDEFLRDRARLPGGIQLADTDMARRFRSKRGPSFSSRLMPSAFGKGGEAGDKRTAEEKLLALQEKSVEYQKIIAEKIGSIALKE